MCQLIWSNLIKIELFVVEFLIRWDKKIRAIHLGQPLCKPISKKLT